jgi:hypothetical protein
MRAFRKQDGQALVLSTMLLVGLLGATGLVVDLGSWFRAQRDTQAIADAAALAGAQELPESPGAASARATEYAKKNGADSPSISFGTTGVGTKTNTIYVEIRKDTPGFFAKIFRINSVNVGAKAGARAWNIGSARWVAPVGVDIHHELIAGCTPLPCFNQPTELDLKKTGPGAWRLLNLDGSRGGTGQQVLASWMLKGYDGLMGVDQWYYSDPGAKFNAGEVQNAFALRFGTEMLFPIYDAVRGQGSNFEYHVVGWIGFVARECDCRGSKGVIKGYFTRVIWDAVQTERGGDPDFGVRAIELIE